MSHVDPTRLVGAQVCNCTKYFSLKEYVIIMDANCLLAYFTHTREVQSLSHTACHQCPPLINSNIDANLLSSDFSYLTLLVRVLKEAVHKRPHPVL